MSSQRLNLPPRKTPIIPSQLTTSPDSINEIEEFLTKYGILNPEEMRLESRIAVRGKPKSFTVCYPLSDEHNHEIEELFHLTVYARQPVLLKYFDTQTKQLVSREAFSSLKELMTVSVQKTREAKLPVKYAGKLLMLTLNPRVNESYTVGEFLEALATGMSTRKFLDFAKAGLSVDSMKDAAEIPASWLNKILGQ